MVLCSQTNREPNQISFFIDEKLVQLIGAIGHGGYGPALDKEKRNGKSLNVENALLKEITWVIIHLHK